ncbi:MAG: hypothetical protein HPY72_01435 [Anaerolineae bacterium]|nr:hypothetical protein [Anaerolineae bacterium]
MGDLQQIYINLKPFLAWVFYTTLQVLFCSLIWFFRFFFHKDTLTNERDSDDELAALLFIFIFLIAIKLFFVIPTAYGPVIQGDEQRYFNIARYLYNGVFDVQDLDHSPLLYPSMLTPAFLFGQKAYAIIKILNVIFSSSMAFPLFLLSREYFTRKTALMITLTGCLLPYHLIFPRLVMSENLYFSLLLWVILFLLNRPQNERHLLPWSFITGVAIGLLYLTRFITLALIPFFIFIWLYVHEKKLSGQGGKNKNIRGISRLLMLLLGIFAGFSPWLITGLKARLPLNLILGFDVTSQTTSSQLTVGNFIIWIFLYICYLILMAAPVLPFYTSSAITTFKKWEVNTRNWMVMLFSLLAGFLIACARHSWRALYNSDVPSKIMGRYVLYFTPLFIIGALLLAQENKNTDRPALRKLIFWRGIFPFGIAGLAYAILFNNLFHLHDGDLIIILGSVDGAYFRYLGIYYFLILVAIYLVILWLTWAGEFKMLIKVMFGLLILLYTIGIPAYYRELLTYQDYQYLADYIIKMHQAGNTAISDTIQILTPPDTTGRDRNLMFNTVLFNNYNALEVTQIRNYADDITLDKATEIQNVIIEKIDGSKPQISEAGRIIEFNNSKYQLLFR